MLLGDNRGAWLSESLELRGDVRCLADDAALLCASFIGDLPHDYQASGNPDPRLQRRKQFQRGNSRDQFKGPTNRTLGIVLVGFRIAKREYDSIPVGVCDESLVPTSRFNDTAMIASDDLTYVLRVHSSIRGPEQQLARRDGELAAFGERGFIAAYCRSSGCFPPSSPEGAAGAASTVWLC